MQGRDEAAAARLLADAQALAAAGAAMLVLELVPSQVANTLQAALTIPVIGIGAGPGVAGQVLVLHRLVDVFVVGAVAEGSEALRSSATLVALGSFLSEFPSMILVGSGVGG